MVVTVLARVVAGLDVRVAPWFPRKRRSCVMHVPLSAPADVQEHVDWAVLEVEELELVVVRRPCRL